MDSCRHVTEILLLISFGGSKEMREHCCRVLALIAPLLYLHCSVVVGMPLNNLFFKSSPCLLQRVVCILLQGGKSTWLKYFCKAASALLMLPLQPREEPHNSFNEEYIQFRVCGYGKSSCFLVCTKLGKPTNMNHIQRISKQIRPA